MKKYIQKALPLLLTLLLLLAMGTPVLAATPEDATDNQDALTVEADVTADIEPVDTSDSPTPSNGNDAMFGWLIKGGVVLAIGVGFYVALVVLTKKKNNKGRTSK